jgi:hypothetical protein
MQQLVWFCWAASLLPNRELATRMDGPAVLEDDSETLGEIARRFGAEFQQSRQLRSEETCTLYSLAACRTALCGWHRYRCDQCDHEAVHYNSCGNRNCPQCQNAKRGKWLADRQREILPVPYYHVIIPLPAELSRLSLYNRKLVFDMFFRCVEATLKEVAQRRCGLAKIGYLAVLHTWGQQLQNHVHLHLIVAGGGITDTGEWKTLPENFLLPGIILRRVFRAKMLEELLEAFFNDELRFGPEYLENGATFIQQYGQLLFKEWVVHIKPPLHGKPEIVLKYLARYVHRVGISNSRILKIDGDRVTFSYKDYNEDGNPTKEKTTTAFQFLDLFLQHVTPTGFKRIRYSGFWSGPRAAKNISEIRERLTGR